MLENRNEYETIFSLEGHHWWYRVLHERTIQSIQQHFSEKNISILDAGCGTGGLIKKLSESGYGAIIGTDISDTALDLALKKTNTTLRKSDLRNYFSEFPNEKHDVIVFNDVLYFFSETEIQFILQEANNALNKHGIIIINFPAGKIFSGNHDRAVAIKKRTSKGEFAKLVPGSMLVEQSVYWPFLLSPAIAVVRAFQRNVLKNQSSDLKETSSSINNLLYRITASETHLFPHAPMGSSFFCVLKK
ncbi:MAG: class I SAM-dependent methyltransferase [Bacteroidota bacterium]